MVSHDEVEGLARIDEEDEAAPLFDQEQLILSDHADLKAAKRGGNNLLKNDKFREFLLGKD